MGRVAVAAEGTPVNLKTVLGWFGVSFVIWWIIEAPAGAAHVVHNIGTFLTSAAHGISDFFAMQGGNLPGWVWGLIFLGVIVVVAVIGMAVLSNRDR